MELVLRRCFPEIKYRVLGVKYIFNVDLLPRLAAWIPGRYDVLDVARVRNSKLLLSDAATGQMWVKIPDYLQKSFDAHDVPKQLRDNVPYYLFDIDSISAWLQGLLGIFHSLQDIVNGFRDADWRSIQDLFYHLHLLYLYLYDLHEFLDVIFDLPSLVALLSILRITGEAEMFRGKRHVKDVGDLQGTSPDVMHSPCTSYIELPAPKPNIPRFEAEFLQEPHENNGRVLLRYLKTVVAWFHAVISLNRSKLLRSGLAIDLNIVHAPVAPTSNDMDSVQTVLDELLPHNTTEAARTELLGMFKSPTTFHGTVHCEAMIMGLTTACSMQSPGAEVPVHFKELFKVNFAFLIDSDAFSVNCA